MKIRFKKLKDNEKMELLDELHAQSFPGEKRDFTNDDGWVVLGNRDEVIGFCSVRVIDKSEAFLSRSGSFKPGLGIQRSTIRHRLKWIKRRGIRYAVTYAHPANYRSVANLIRSGFHLYSPAWQYAGKGYLYFIKDLHKPR